MFRKRRLGLRKFVISAAVIGAIYGLMPAQDKQTAEIDPQVVVAIAPEGPAIDVTDAVLADAAPRSYDTLNLKSAFDAKPAAPGYQFGATEEAASSKPKAQLIIPPPVETAALAAQLSSIQTGITRILEGTGPALKEMLDQKKELQVGKGDTLMELLIKNEVPRDEAYNAIQALRKVYDPRDLNPGHQVTVFFHKDPAEADPHFVGLRIERDAVNSVAVNRGDDGSFKVNAEAKALHKEMKAFRGTIDNSLYVDAKQAGVPDRVILDLIKMYSWGVDFQREIHNGDSFEVMYEQYVTDDGRVVPGKGEIAYATMRLSGRDMPLYRYEDKNGDSEYFDPAGQSVKKPLMKTPIDGARISSTFGVRRHPVLGYNKMHKGIDFAAPRGTPIYAAGDGVIERAGKFSSFGNYVRIRHRNGLCTAYGHMNGFRSGIRAGGRVKQGDVIGYVGTTGRSTGPHLHYEILVNGAQVNPATVKVAGGRSLSAKELKGFKAQVHKMDIAFAKEIKGSQPANVASNDNGKAAQGN